MYELRHDTDPSAMPGGTGLISRHRTLAAAVSRYRAESRRRVPARDLARGAWMAAVVIDTATGARTDPRDGLAVED